MNTLKKIKLYTLLLATGSLNFASTPIPQDSDFLEEVQEVRGLQDILSLFERHGINAAHFTHLNAIVVNVVGLLKQALQEAKKGNKQEAQEALDAVQKNIILLHGSGKSAHQNLFATVLDQKIVDLAAAKIMIEIQKAQEKQNAPVVVQPEQEEATPEQSAQEEAASPEILPAQSVEDAKAHAVEEARRKKELKEEARRAKEVAQLEKEEARRKKEQARLEKEEARRAKAQQKEAARVLPENTQTETSAA